MATWDDRRCVLGASFAQDSLVVLKAMLSTENVFKAGCNVKKHPACCALCVANNDCSRLPVHVNCRCEPEPTLTSLE